MEETYFQHPDQVSTDSRLNLQSVYNIWQITLKKACSFRSVPNESRQKLLFSYLACRDGDLSLFVRLEQARRNGLARSLSVVEMHSSCNAKYYT